MAIFDTNKKRYLTYYVVINDAARIASLQAQYPNGLNTAIKEPRIAGLSDPLAFQPQAAETLFAPAVFRGYTDPNAGAPYIWTPFYSANPADPSSKPFPLNDRRFDRHSGGFLGIGGTTITYYWIAKFVLPGTITTTGGEGNIPKRFLVDGFETPLSGIYRSGDGGANVTREASRHVSGTGVAFRSCASVSGAIAITSLDAAATNVCEVWDRMYIRLRRPPSSGSIEFFHMEMDGADGNSAGFGLQMLPSGQVKFVHRRFAGPVDFGTSAALPVWTGRPDDHAWVRLDILTNMRGNGNIKANGRFRVYMRGVLIGDFACPAAGAGIGASNGRINNYRIGNSFSTANDMELDMDDWRSSAIPGTDGQGGGTEALTSIDWKLGSKIVRLRGTSLSASSSGWTGGADFRATRQQPLTVTAGNMEAAITSNVSGALLELETDHDIVAKDPGAFSATSFAAMTVQHSGLRAGVANGSLGYRLGASAAVDTGITEAGTKTVDQRAFYTVPGSANTFPAGTTPIRLRHTKGADANTAQVFSLSGQVEIIGRWGKEDHVLADIGGAELPEYQREPGPHNAPYPLVAWAMGSNIANASAPVIYQSGTYVGNGTGQDLQFRAPVAWIYIRTEAGTNAGVFFHATAHLHKFGITTGSTPQPHDAVEDVGFVPGSGEDTQMQRYFVRLSGSHAQINQNAVTYRYVALMDPGARFFLGICPSVGANIVSQTQKLPNPTFTPEFALMGRGSLSGSPSLSYLMKHSGMAVASRANFFGGVAAISTAITFAAGEFLIGPTFGGATAYSNCPMLMMRRADGNNDTNQAAVLACGTYIGDGTATRTFNVGSAGKRPLFLMIAPSDTGSGVYRDPGHLTNTSTTSAGGTTTTGITAGAIDGFTVGSAMNVNTVEYVWWLLWGNAAAGNGGWSTDGEVIPVEADMPADGDGAIPDPSVYDTPVTPTTLPGEPDLEDTTPILTTGDDIGGQIGGSNCESYTRGIVNLALSHLEISKVVGNLNTENSEAASLARRHVKHDVNTTLRDFPWDFATRYANLVLVAGSETAPVNNDWTYAYRAPNSMMFARRIAKIEKGRKFDDQPITFRQGQDASGLLIYCNSLATATVPLVLEYTVRNECPAFWGDALFREALSWRIAASLSSLAKDGKKKEFCLGVYLATLERARTVDSKEQQQEQNGDADWISGRN